MPSIKHKETLPLPLRHTGRPLKCCVIYIGGPLGCQGGPSVLMINDSIISFSLSLCMPL